MPKRNGFSEAANNAWRTRRRIQRKMIKTVHIIECIPENGDVFCSEGKMLNEDLKIVNFQENNRIDIKYREASSPKELLYQIYCAEGGCVHISCHGNFDKEGTCLATNDGGKLYSHDLLYPPQELLPIREDSIDEDNFYDYEEVHLWSNLDNDDKPILVFLSSCLTAKRCDLINAFFSGGCRYVIAPKREVSFADSAFFYNYILRLDLLEKDAGTAGFQKG